MEYVTKKCPHCNCSYTLMEPKGAGRYGSPVRTCNKCKQTFIDKDYREIAVQGIREVDNQKVSPLSVISLFMGIFFGIGIFYLFGIDVIAVIIAIISVLLPTLNLISEYRKYDERQAYFIMEKRNSERRLENYEYASFLKDIGYDVPQKYLEQTEKNDDSETNSKTYSAHTSETNSKTYSAHTDDTWICNIRR